MSSPIAGADGPGGRRPGRPRGDTGARERILAVATAHFRTQGYRATSVRGVARDAGVDHALVHHYYGTKEGLFRAALALASTPAEVLDAVPGPVPPERLGSAVLQAALEVWERPDAADGLAGLVQDALHEPAVMAVARDYLEGAVIARLAGVVGGRNASHRAAAASAVLSGVFFSRYILRVEPMASMLPQDVVRVVGPAVGAALRRR